MIVTCVVLVVWNAGYCYAFLKHDAMLARYISRSSVRSSVTSRYYEGIMLVTKSFTWRYHLQL